MQQHIETEAQSFESSGEVLVSWQIHGASYDKRNNGCDWQFQSQVISTIEEAESFAAKLAGAIEGAKARRAKAAARAEPKTEQTAEEKPAA